MTKAGPESSQIDLSAFEALPDDVLGLISSQLEVHEILRLQRISRAFGDRISHFGIPFHLAKHPISYHTIYPTSTAWSPYNLLNRNTIINKNLHNRRWHALQVGQTWPAKVIPTIHITSDHLIIGEGTRILQHPFLPGPTGAKVIQPARAFPVAPKWSGSGADVVGVVELSDGQLGIAQYNGTLQRFRLPNAANTGSKGSTYNAYGTQTQLQSTAHYSHPKGSNIHTLTGSGDLMMTTTSMGLVSLWKANSPWEPPKTFQLPQGNRAWSSLLDITGSSNSGKKAFLGISGSIDIHSIYPTGISSTPYRQFRGPDLPSTSSPYDLKLPPNPSVHNPNTLLSAWYDSHLRLHDLRSSPSAPKISLLDPWQWADGSAMYSCAFVGENYVAGGGARHGAVSFFDLRYPKSGWSCFTPGGKGSPVYALQGDGGRVWGVTEKRAFVLAFDGTGDVAGGLIAPEAKAKASKVVDRPNGYKGRGGKWGWTVRYNKDEDKDKQEGAVGYAHADRGVSLFDSIPVAS